MAALSLAVLGACGDDDPHGGSSGSGGRGGSSGSGGATAGTGGGGTAGSDGGSNDAGATAVTIRFKAKVGDADFACGQEYPNQGSTGVRARPLDFRFYVENLRMITRTGEEVPVTLDARSPWQSREVALIDFETGAAQSCNGDAATNTTITGSVPAGDYTGIAFVNGVPESINHSDPAFGPAPLQAPGMNWNWLFGFRFFIAELAHADAVMDAGAGDGGALPGLGLLHAGSTACSDGSDAGGGGHGHGGGSDAGGGHDAGASDAAHGDSGARRITCAKPNRNQVRLSGFDAQRSFVVADIGAVFTQTDLTLEATCHSGSEYCGPVFDNLGVNYATGAPLLTQSIYRVE
ncbi:MAG TPA: MbnP family copper-binding protein [Polyangiaceae bacterium]